MNKKSANGGRKPANRFSIKVRTALNMEEGGFKIPRDQQQTRVRFASNLLNYTVIKLIHSKEMKNKI